MSRSRRAVKRRYKKPLKYRREKSRNALGSLWAVLVVIGIWYALMGRTIFPLSALNAEAVGERDKYTVPCTQANVAKIVALTLTDEISEMGEESDELWYSKYYKTLNEKLGFETLDEKNALDSLEAEDLVSLLDEVLGAQYGVSLGTPELHKGQVVDLEVFIDTYKKALEQVGKEVDLDYENLVVLATPADDATLKAWQVATDGGCYGFEGIVLDPFKDKTLQVVTQGSEIVGVMKVVSDASVVKACYIKEVGEKEATFEMNNRAYTYTNRTLTSEDIGSICDITLQGGTIISFEVQLDKDVDTVLRITSDTIELAKGGVFSYDKVKVYDESDKNKYTSIRQIPYGTQVKYTIEGNGLTSLKIVKKDRGGDIRVILSNDGKYVQQGVNLVSTADYDLVYNGEVTTWAANTSWQAERFDWIKGKDTISFVPREESMIKVLSMSKKDANPKYKGIIEVRKVEGGYLVINEVDLEDYVAGVIPSEMPTSYGLEALKVQAIAARTFAVISQKSSKYIVYGAQIDDTTDSQVYNNIGATDLSYEAAKATRGQILNSDSGTISSKFFATSCGYTANFGEVWASGSNFPSQTPSYLVSRQQYIGDPLVSDMSKEEDAYTFLTMKPEEVNAFDKNSSWFRWTVTLNGEELSNLLNPAISKLSKAYPDLVQVKVNNGVWRSEGLESVGDIKAIEVKERGQGGNIMELVVVGTEKTIKIETEYLIRSLFSSNANQGLKVIRADGTEVNSMSLLPSAFFVMDVKEGEGQGIEEMVIHGGGFGHGVGMSQDGVKGMVAMGYGYKEIINHYYPNLEIAVVE